MMTPNPSLSEPLDDGASGITLILQQRVEATGQVAGGVARGFDYVNLHISF